MDQDMKSGYILPLEDTVLFPGTGTRLLVDRATGSFFQARYSEGEDTAVGLTLQAGHKLSNLSSESFFSIGNLIKINAFRKAEKGYVLDIETLVKVKSLEISSENDRFVTSYQQIEDEDDLDDKNEQEIIEYVKTIIQELGKNFQGAEPFIKPLLEMNSIERIMAGVVPVIPVTTAEKQELMEIPSVKERSLRFIDLLLKQKDSIRLQIEMAKKFSERTNKTYRENLLREQMRAIQEELGETKGGKPGKKDYRAQIEESDMPEDVRSVALEELAKLDGMGQGNPESTVVRNYLDLLIALPWETKTIAEIDIEKARGVLEEHHFGLDKVKERIIQHLAVMKLKKEKQGSILLLVGPPGTGKTSLGKSIAEALGRKYLRMSLGGIRDEAEIRGHRRTYIGALPGRIIQGMKKAGEKNPVFILDEIDKIMVSYSGDPASALLEVLDPEQNNTFTDHYLELPYDLSDVFFIATANSTSSIPAPLLDRTEVIQISGYTNPEKVKIGSRHLFGKVLEEHGLDDEKLRIDEEAIKGVIENYTREAGVRGLTKQLAKIARVTSEKIVTGKVDLPYTVTSDILEEILGRPMIHLDDIQKESVPGVVTGLAWTPVGGDILFIEGTFMGGKGGLTLTGQLGGVMKESATISLSLIRSRLAHSIGKFDFIKNDIHIHVPAGATPKDGPSAGITMFTALASLLTGKTVDRTTAMTGEITLRGSVLPVGGIKEKVIAAHRAGVKQVILPKENEKDLEDVPEEVRNDLTFVPVESVEEVLKAALGIDLPHSAWVLGKEQDAANSDQQLAG